MNRPCALKNQPLENLFQRLTGKLCPKPLIRDSAPHGNLKNTIRLPSILKKTVLSTSNQSHQNALAHDPSKTLLD